MSLTEKDVAHVATLARLDLTPDEAALMTEQLGRILGFMETLAALDTAGVEPTSHVLPLSNVFRADEAAVPVPVERIQAAAPSVDRGYYRVPRVITAG
jgi:aspartyl-tRNA(Asn)/glutamyl-tRNA(Gln) amidotransferase subunit C